MRSNRQIGILIVLLGNVLFSAKAIFAKLIYQYDVDPTTLLTLRMAFSLPIYLVVAIISRRRKPDLQISKKDWVNLLIFAFLGYYGASLLNFMGLLYITAGLERLILFSYPTMVVVLGAIFYKVPITSRQVLALVLTYFGIAIVFIPALPEAGPGFALGTALVFGSALSFAIYLIRVGKYIQRLGTGLYTSYVMVLATGMIFVHFLLTRDFSALVLPWKVYGLFLMLAIFSTVIPVFLISEGIRRIGASDTSIVASVGPVATIVLANIFLSEPITGIQIFGTAFVLAGVWFVSRAKEPPADPEAMENRVR